MLSGEARECRNCHEPGGDDLIAPCHCTGSLKWVHRSCLDTWRTMSPNPESFYKCDICHFRYRLRRVSRGRWARAAFVLRCVRDTFAVFLGIVAAVLVCGLIMWGIDAASGMTSYFLPTTWVGTKKVVVFDLFVLGFLLLAFVTGIGGSCTFCCGKCCGKCCKCCRPRHNAYTHDSYPYHNTFDCYWYWWWWNPCPMSPVGGGGGAECAECGNCLDSGDCCGGGGDDCGAVLLVLLLIIVVIVILLGFVIGMALLSFAIYAIGRHHARTLRRKISAGELVVIDLETAPEGEEVAGEVVIEIPEIEPSAPPAPEEAAAAAAAAADYKQKPKPGEEGGGTIVRGFADESSSSSSSSSSASSEHIIESIQMKK